MIQAGRQAVQAPYVGFEGEVAAEWIDSNGHMNVSWYDRVYDMAEFDFFAAFGLDEGYIARTQHGMFRLEKHLRYHRELLLGDAIRVESRIVSFDGRLLRHAHVLKNLSKDNNAATMSCVSIHVDLTRRKSAQVADPAARALLDSFTAAHAALPPIDRQ